MLIKKIAGRSVVGVVVLWAWAGQASGQQTGAEAPVAGSVRGLALQSEGVQQGAQGLTEREETPAAVARRSVLDELEQLRGEIAMLTVLREAQDALFGWNSLRVKSGERPTALDVSLCESVRSWCEVLPASFGRAGRKGLE